MVEIGTWLSGRTVLVPPHWIDWIDSPNRSVEIELTAEEIRQSPEYDPHTEIDREYEIKLHEHYARETYWD